MTMENNTDGKAMAEKLDEFADMVMTGANSHCPDPAGSARDKAWQKDYDSIWEKAETRQAEKMHYRRALYAACGGDKNKVRQFLEETEQNK